MAEPHKGKALVYAEPDPSEPKVECVEQRVVYTEPENRWCKLRFDRVRFPNGKEGKHTIVEEFGSNAGMPGVVVLPITASGEVLILRQYRYPVGEWSWEIPRGGPQAGRTAAEQALAELREETGHGVDEAAGGRIVPLTGAGHLWVNSGLLSTEVAYFAAIGITPLAKGRELEDTEVIDHLVHVTPTELYELVREGRVRDQFTVTALGLAVIHGVLPAPPPPPLG